MTRWVPPDQIGEYRLARLLGQGSMGQIYVGHDTVLDRLVAIKFIGSMDPGWRERERFLIEARAIARLQHPNVVAIYRVGEVDDRPYLVYEFIRGESLNRIAMPVDGQLAIKLAVGLARGLAAAHRRNVLHRDIKAANAMLADDGQVKLLDFGLAKLLDAAARAEFLVDAAAAQPRHATAPASPHDTPALAGGETLPSDPRLDPAELTKPGAVMGTPLYMAPEIWRGEPATTRSDVYSMGVLLHMLCVGRPPHCADAIDELRNLVATVDAPSLAHPGSGIDPGFAAVVDSCLARDPARRPASGDELREALERLGQQVRVSVPDEPERRFLAASQRVVRRRRQMRGLSAAVAVAITTAVVVVLVSLNRQSQERLRRLYEEQGRQLLLSGDPMRSLVNLVGAYREGARSTPLRFMLAQGARELGALEASLNGHRGQVWSVAFSPDGSRLVTAGEDRTARLWNAEGMLLHTLAGYAARVVNARFSPDGSRVATASFDSTADIWDANLGVQHCRMKHAAPVHAVVFSPDGRQVTTAAADGVARVWDTTSCALVHELAPPGHVGRRGWQPAELVAYAPSGNQVALWSDGGSPTVWDAHAGTLVRALEGHRGRMFGVAFAPDGSRIVAGFSDGTASIFDVAAGRELLTLSGHRGPITSHRFSADGKQVLTTSEDGTAKVWDATSGALRVSLEASGVVRSAQWSPDARWIVTSDSDGSVRRWDAIAGGLENTFPGHVDEVVALAFDPRGERLATAGADGTAKIWNARWSRYLRTFEVSLPRNRIMEGRGDTFGAISRDGTLVMNMGGKQGAVHLWDLATGHAIATLGGHLGGTEGGDFSPGGRTLVTCGRDRTVKIWNISSRRLEQSLEGHGDLVARVRFNPDGSRLVTASRDGTARIWDVSGGREIAVLPHGQEVLDARFSPDGTRIATGSRDGIVRIWDTARLGEPLLMQGHTDKVLSAMFSPDGETVVSTSGDKTVRIWDAHTAKQLFVLEGHKREVLDAAFSPDGELIATASLDATFRVWDTSGRMLAAISQRSPLMSIAWSQDGRYILTTTIDGSSQLWSAEIEPPSPAHLEALLRCRVPFRLEHERVVRDTVRRPCTPNGPAAR